MLKSDAWHAEHVRTIAPVKAAACAAASLPPSVSAVNSPSAVSVLRGTPCAAPSISAAGPAPTTAIATVASPGRG